MPLTGNPVKDIYNRFLNLPNNISGALQKVKDGLGTNSALSLSTTKVSVAALDFDTSPTLLTSGTQPALVLDGLAVRTRTIYPFGFSQKDPFDAYFEYVDSSAYTAADGVSTLVVNNAVSSIEKIATDFTPTDAYDTATNKWLPSLVDSKDVFKLVLEINIAPAAAWVAGDWLEIGLEYDGSAAATNGIKYYTMPKGASVVHQITYEHTFVVNPTIITNGVRIFAKPVGADVNIDGCKATLIRVMKG